MLIEGLKTPDQNRAAADLIKTGSAALPLLLEALERRDVELRQRVHQVLQQILRQPVAFDPFAPEAVRRQQIAALRDRIDRKAG